MKPSVSELELVFRPQGLLCCRRWCESAEDPMSEHEAGCNLVGETELARSFCSGYRWIPSALQLLPASPE